MENLVYLIDTNVFLEVILKQEKSNQVKSFLNNNTNIAITDFSIHSIGILLFRKNQGNSFLSFLTDLSDNNTQIIKLGLTGLSNVKSVAEKFSMDFDDAYQYTASKGYDLIIVSFDKDFDKTDLKRIEP